MARNSVKGAAAKRAAATKKAIATRYGKQYGLTGEEWSKLSPDERSRLFWEKYLREHPPASPVPPPVEPEPEPWPEPEPEPWPEPEPPEDDDESEDVWDIIGDLSAPQLVTFMLDLMPDKEAKTQLRKLLAEIPSDDYMQLAAELYKIDPAERAGYIIRRHSSYVEERRQAEQEFLQSPEFEKAIGDAVDPKSWM